MVLTTRSMSCLMLCSRSGVPTWPRKYLLTTTFVASWLQKTGTSTSFCSKTVLPVSEEMPAVRYSQAISSYGWTPGRVHRRSKLRPRVPSPLKLAPYGPPRPLRGLAATLLPVLLARTLGVTFSSMTGTTSRVWAIASVLLRSRPGGTTSGCRRPGWGRPCGHHCVPGAGRDAICGLGAPSCWRSHGHEGWGDAQLRDRPSDRSGAVPGRGPIAWPVASFRVGSDVVRRWSDPRTVRRRRAVVKPKPQHVVVRRSFASQHMGFPVLRPGPRHPHSGVTCPHLDLVHPPPMGQVSTGPGRVVHRTAVLLCTQRKGRAPDPPPATPETDLSH